MTSSSAGYSAVADQQLDELEQPGPFDLYAAAIETCESILTNPGWARRRSAAITTPQGIIFRTAITGFPDVKVFWSTDGPRIEAIFPYRT